MLKNFLGRGWRFPVEVDDSTGKIKLSEGEEDISEAIKIIIGTAKGERVMRPDFGCDIHKFIFGSTDITTLKLLEAKIKEAIETWEPRVEKVGVQAKFDERNHEKLLININYVVRSTNNIFNLVYPFYINEGTN